MRLLKTPIWLTLMIALLVTSALLGIHWIKTGIRPVLPDPCITVSLAELKPANIVVRVYNGGSERGLAGKTAKTLKTAGFIIAATGNTDEPIHDTVIVGVAEDSPEVQFVAAWFEKVTVRADGRQDHTVDILVGDAGAPMVPEDQRPLSLTIPSGLVCVPPTASPLPEPTPEEGAEAPPEGEVPQ
jgi:hypothetical protein